MKVAGDEADGDEGGGRVEVEIEWDLPQLDLHLPDRRPIAFVEAKLKTTEGLGFAKTSPGRLGRVVKIEIGRLTALFLFTLKRCPPNFKKKQ